MKKTLYLLLFLSGLVLSCGTAPEKAGTTDQAVTDTQIEAAAAEEHVSEAKPVEEEEFDPSTISEEIYTAAKIEIQALISDLNRIIRARNYDAWINYLDESYLGLISSRDFLNERTEDLYKRDQIVAQNMGKDPRLVEKKILRTARDYFTNVVVPSRSNDRVDDIDFISEHNVKAYTIDTRGQKLVLYHLAEINGKWKIIG